MLALALALVLVLAATTTASARQAAPPAVVPGMGPGAADAAEAPVWSADTGNAWVDRQLADINLYAERYPDSFIDEVVRYSGARRGYVAALLQQHGWAAGDIYFACFWARASGVDLRTLVRARSASPASSWRDVLASLDAEPENTQLRALRHAIVASYERWDRPITLDAVLRAQLQQAGRLPR